MILQKGVHGSLQTALKRLAMTGRAVQLDGVRALAMMAICWDHWCPAGWPRVFPFEIFLFFFLVMTGYMITGSLLRERGRGEASGVPWRWQALKIYQIRRSLRIMAPYYAALLLALVVGAPDVWRGLGWYVAHLSNFHMATLGEWPPGTNHFWSLAMQQQFYFVWPFVIWWLPRKMLLPAIWVMIGIGPLARFHHGDFAAWVAWPQLLTWASLDYFGLGALLAWMVARGVSLEHPALKWISWAGLVGYLVIFHAEVLGISAEGWRSLQQTFLSVSLCGFIAAASVGFRGVLGRLLQGEWLQSVGKVSYGIYLFHNLAPLLAGKLCWFLWEPIFQNPAGEWLRIVIFALTTWGLTQASWYWIEQPLQAVRAKRFGGSKSLLQKR